jgi:hypothetical protein
VATDHALFAHAPVSGLAGRHRLHLPVARFDARFIGWRLIMFIPFGLLVAVLLRWRPPLLPYMVVVHMLMDASVMYFVMAAS